jgi:hypothetical protein
MSYLSREEANKQREIEAAEVAERHLADAIFTYGPVLGPLFEAAVRVEGVPPEEIARRQNAYLSAVWDTLRNSYLSDNQEQGLIAMKAITALAEHENETLKAELVRLQMRVTFGS